MLISTLDMLHAAGAGGYAIGGFNVYNLEGARAVVAEIVDLDGVDSARGQRTPVARVGAVDDSLVASTNDRAGGIEEPPDRVEGVGGRSHGRGHRGGRRCGNTRRECAHRDGQ